MGSDRPPENEPLPLEALERREGFCRRFEDMWRRGLEPSIAEMIAGSRPEEREQLLGALLPLDFCHRRRRGEKPSRDTYLTLLPKDTSSIEAIFEEGAWGEALGAGASAAGSRAARGGGRAPSPSSLHLLGTSIGPYRLLEVMGEGGMGVVYLAEQDAPLRRRVALKLVQPGRQSGEFLARFDLERQALALMSHSGIARVHDAGLSPDGRPYFVMEHVAGDPITDFADRERLGVRERLELLVEVCGAVEHAHRRGVIHRDLKPTNILVRFEDGKPCPKVIDFGLAKAMGGRLTELTFHTLAGELLGTPEYMSPEQASTTRLAVDPRVDVYSLGVVLYELLSGALPFDWGERTARDLVEILRSLREDEPPPLRTRLRRLGKAAEISAQLRGTNVSTLARAVRGDLNWIVLRALEKQPRRRYASARHLAEDIERHLRGEPVNAGPPSAIHALGKLLRQRRRAAVFAAIALAALAVGGVVARGLVEESRARRSAEGELRGEARESSMGSGVVLEDWSDGHTLAATGGPADDRRTGRATILPSRNLYFRVSDPALKVAPSVWIRATVYDDPRFQTQGPTVTLQYTSARSSGPEDLPNTFARAHGALPLTGSGRWVQAIWYLPDAGFRSFMRGVADFRLAVGGERSIVVAAVDVAAGVPPLDGPVDRAALERVTPRVLELYEEHLFPARVLEAIAAEPSLTPAERDASGRVAALLPRPDPFVLNNQTWEVVNRPGGSAAAYARALRKMEAACSIPPPNANHLHTLGLALYRAERYADALETLWQAERLNSLLPSPFNSSIDLILIAMCEEQLGRKPEAAFLQKAALRMEGANPGPDMVGHMLEAQNLIAAPAEWTPLLDLVLRAFEDGLTLAVVEARLLEDPSLVEASRSLALRMARALGDLTRAMLLTMSRGAVDASDAGVFGEELGRALRQTEAACALAPGDLLSQLRLGDLRFRMGNYPEVIATLGEVVRAQPERLPPSAIARIAILSGRSHARLGEHEKGVAILEKALQELATQQALRTEVAAALAEIRAEAGEMSTETK